MAGAYVSRDAVMRALNAAGPPHSPKKLTIQEHPDWWVTVSDNDKWTLLEYIPPEVSMRTVNHLSERFRVPKVWFHEPLKAPGDEEQRQPN